MTIWPRILAGTSPTMPWPTSRSPSSAWGSKEKPGKRSTQLSSRFPSSKALPPSRLRLAEAALDAGQADRAIVQFRLVLGLDPSGKEDTDRAKDSESAQAAVEAPIRLRALAGLGRAVRKLGKPADAAVVFGRFLDSSAGDPMAPQVALDRAAALEVAKQTDDALAAYARVGDRYPRTDQALRARLDRARLLARTGHADEAATDYMKLLFDRERRTRLAAMGVKPDRVLAALGWALSDSGQLEEADRIFASLLETYPDSPRAIDARFNLAESANLARNLPEVVRLLSPLVATPASDEGGKEPGPPSASASPPLRPAKPAADEPAKPPDPTSRRLMPLALYRLGRTQLELGDWPAGAATLDRLVAEYPSGPRSREARFLRGEAALRQGAQPSPSRSFPSS